MICNNICEEINDFKTRIDKNFLLEGGETMPKEYTPISAEGEQFMDRPPEVEDKPTLTPEEARQNMEQALQALVDDPEGGD